MKKAYWVDGRLLTERDLKDIRAQLEGFKRVTAISDEMRDLIETEWPRHGRQIAVTHRLTRWLAFGTPGSERH
jgi:hypothetical protein